MLADLRDVDGLPPKTAASGQPRAHEGTLPVPFGVPVPSGGPPKCP